MSKKLLFIISAAGLIAAICLAFQCKPFLYGILLLAAMVVFVFVSTILPRAILQTLAPELPKEETDRILAGAKVCRPFGDFFSPQSDLFLSMNLAKPKKEEVA